MSAEKFASLTANFLLRGSEPGPAGIVPSEPIAFPHAAERGARRADSLPARRAIIAPIGVDPNGDGGVTLSVAGAAENFRHDEDAQGWVGDCGSFLTGTRDLFSEPRGWHVAISVNQGQHPIFEIRHHNMRLPVTFGDCGDSLLS